MVYTVKILPIALKDLRNEKIWYQEQSENIGEEFKKEIYQEIDYISKNPNHFQLKYQSIRQALVKPFPYAIFYFIDEERARIVLVGILHVKRNPKIIRKRIK